MTTPLNTTKRIVAKKSLGQNFLVNPGILEKIVSTAKVEKSDTVVEVGPGTGILTEKLAACAGRVIAIEKDRRLIAPLKEKFSNTNVEIVEADVLKLEIETLVENWKLKTGNYKLVSNIPYYITSHFLRTVFQKWPQPKLIVLMVQKEVARRIMAGTALPAGRQAHMNLLALSVQLYAEPRIVSYVSQGSFRPMPKVDSAVIRLIPSQAIPSTEERKMIFSLMGMGFRNRRKQLLPLLAKQTHINRARLSTLFQDYGILPTARAENLTLAQWKALTRGILKT